MKNIIITGIGGVGGYFGGVLAKYFQDSGEVEIVFFARGKHLEEIRENGLKVIKGDTEFIARPSFATDTATEIGQADFIILCTKSYDLESVVESLRPCITKDTILLPLLNGVDSKERISALLPDNLVLDGCAYIVSRLIQPGVVENSGNIQKLFFGLDQELNDQVRLLERLFKEAHIEALASSSISSIIWEKFIFISPTATATSYFNNTMGEILADPMKLSIVSTLIEEVIQLAKAKGITVPENMAEITLNKWKALPYETTSSMHSDFKNKKPNTELESLTGYVIREGEKCGLEMACFRSIYTELLLINSNY